MPNPEPLVDLGTPAAGHDHAPADLPPTRPLDPDALVDRYVEMWMERDPAARRRRVREVWARDGAQILEPPELLRETARALGFPHAGLEVRGHDALEFRVTRAHEEFVGEGRHVFRRQGHAARVADAVKFRWEMASAADGAVVAVGLDLLLLDGDGRILRDYQFIER